MKFSFFISLNNKKLENQIKNPQLLKKKDNAK